MRVQLKLSEQEIYFRCEREKPCEFRFCAEVLSAALRPHEALDCAREQKQEGLTVRRIVLHKFFGRNASPLFIEPSIPNVLGIRPIRAFNPIFIASPATR